MRRVEASRNGSWLKEVCRVLRRYAACSASASACPSATLVSPELFPPDLPDQLPWFSELSSLHDLPALGWFIASPLHTVLLVQLSLSRFLSIVFAINVSWVTASLPLPLHLSFVLLQSYCLTSRSTVHSHVSSLLATEAGNAVAICAMAEDTLEKRTVPWTTDRHIELSICVASMTTSVLLFLRCTGEATWHDFIFLDFSSV